MAKKIIIDIKTKKIIIDIKTKEIKEVEYKQTIEKDIQIKLKNIDDEIKLQKIRQDKLNILLDNM